MGPKAKKTLIAATFSLSGLIVLAGLFFSTEILIKSHISPGLHVGSLNLGLKSAENAQRLIAQQAEKYYGQKFTISFGESRITTSVADLGIEIFPEETIKEIKRGGFLQASVLDLFTNDQVFIPASIDLDSEQIIKELGEQLSFSKLEAKNANFYFDQAGNLQISEASPGLVINKGKLIQDIKDAAENVQAADIEVEFIKADAEISADMLEAQRAEIMEILKRQTTLVDPIYSDPWKIKLIDHKDWVIFEENKPGIVENLLFEETGSYVSVKIDPLKLNEFIDAEISKWLDKPVAPVSISMDENDKVVIDGVGIDGSEIEREKLHRYFEAALRFNTSEIVIPIKIISPELIVSKDLQKLGIKDIVGVGHTSYYGSHTNRIFNINVGAAKLNGGLIAPGETYSFNEHLGPVDGSTGFRKELVIKPEGTLPEYGGGICQVSTTFYRALIFSDLPIVERHPHSYAVSYYSQILGHGLDATIYIGGPDVKFTNDTKGHLLVQFYVKDDNELYVIFYGTKEDFTVEMEGPYLSGYHNPGPTIYVETADLAPGQTKQVEVPHTGFSALWYKHVKYGDGTTKTEEILTKYKAIPAKVMVGAGAQSSENGG